METPIGVRHLLHAAGLCVLLAVGGTKREELAFRIDHWCLAILPLLFYGWVAWALVRAAR